MPKVGHKRCASCKVYRELNQFYNDRVRKDGKNPSCKFCIATFQKNYKIRGGVSYRLWLSSYQNSKRHNIPHTITPKDIVVPETCKYLGVNIDKLAHGQKWDAPSIDRIDPTLGYIPGNIQVISNLANRMKTNATVDQMLMFARGVIRVHG